MAYGRPNFGAGEIWWCQIGVNVGDEEDGKGDKFMRPVLIFRKLSKNIFLGVPLSSKLKESYLYCNFEFKNNKQSAIIGQVRVFDSKRLGDRMGKLNKHEFNKIKEELKRSSFEIYSSPLARRSCD